jgi:DNA-directed RNA polymerase subunit RPC12/RpoP
VSVILSVAPPEPNVNAENEPEAHASEAKAAWPRCGYCGSAALHESRRGGWTESLLRLAGCTLYRCEDCGRRFAFAKLGRPERHRRGAGPPRSTGQTPTER